MYNSLSEIVIYHHDNKDFLLFFMAFIFNGLQTNCFFCSAITVGCLGFHEPTCCDGGGLPINFLLLCEPMGVSSTGKLDTSLTWCKGEFTLDVLHTLCGSQTNDCLPITRSVLIRALDLFIGVVTLALFVSAGRNVAIDARLLGWWWIDWFGAAAGEGLTAIDPRLAFMITAAFVLVVPAIDVLDVFFLLFPAGSGIREFLVLYAGGGTGDGGGMRLVIPRSGNRSFDGASGGFFSTVFLCDWLKDEMPEDWVDKLAKALLSCFRRVFLSSTNWLSRSLTCWHF